MTGGLRVLYLGPPSRYAYEPFAYSFLSEEIRALTECGVEAFVIAPAGRPDADMGPLHVRGLPLDTPGRRVEVLRFVLRHLTGLPLADVLHLSRWYGVGRVECFAEEVIERERIDLIHSYFGWPRGFGGMLARAKSRIPLLAHLRGNDLNTCASLGYGARRQRSFDRAIRQLLRTADMTVYVSESLRRQGIALGAQAARSRVIMQGIDLSVFQRAKDKPSLRVSLGLGNGPVLLAVAGLIPIKGVDWILESVARLGQAHPYSLLVCGEGRERNALEQRAAALGLQNRTQFLGRVPRSQIVRYFQASDVFVHGSVLESAGYAILEALACGLPVICTNSGGPAEYVEDGVTGFVIRTRDSQSMADKILLLLQNSTLRSTFARNARLRAEKFPRERMIDETLDTYRSLISSSRDNRGTALTT